MQHNFDVIVVGGGHAGTEAALAAARAGAKTLLLTQNIETIGQMSCNPAIGGIGKSHLVREIDAMGGVMAHAADLAGIQFRVLNRRKGPAVRATRAQTDRALYRQAIRSTVENQENLVMFQQEVDDLIMQEDRVCGVVTRMGLQFKARAVVLTVGTFLGGRIHVGPQTYTSGRAGDAASIRLAERLRELDLQVDRLKTGTPPRIDGKSIDYSPPRVPSSKFEVPLQRSSSSCSCVTVQNGVCYAHSSTVRRRGPLPLGRRTHGGQMGWLLRTYPGRRSKVLLYRSMLLVVWLLRE